jgi:hypothetical protein
MYEGHIYLFNLLEFVGQYLQQRISKNKKQLKNMDHKVKD